MLDAKRPVLLPCPAPPSPPSTARGSRAASEDGNTSPHLPSPVSDEPPGLKNYPLPPSNKIKTVLPQDLKTPDSHVERDPRLIRLTGVHPFNVEAPLTDLYNEGFLTSEDLHYVRNHGAVPECGDTDMLDWTFSIDGMVDNPITVPVRDLIETFDQVTYPITLVCAGNRRKEQNVVRKSKGFSWGPAGLSTALWTGVPIAKLLALAKPRRGAKYVCFEGADKLPNGYYGTSIKLNWCMDPNRGVLVSHKMNGQTLHPDHGKPVRIVIPGQIGGRSVKWLKKITVTATPSDNWYHIYDNRVLPTTITPEESANLPEVWKDERYAIYDLNANSAICYPQHDERVAVTDATQSYKVRGYAYAGGGKRITRMEVTLDKGKSWRLAQVHYPEDEYRLAPEGDTLYGGKVDMWWRETSFCWCFWELDMPMAELCQASDIMIRGMDEGMMVQPRDMYWSVLGMMNNPWFRVVIHKEHDNILRFEHPTQPALMPGGWMERVKKAGGNLGNGFWGEKTANNDDIVAQEPDKEICMTNPKVDRIMTLDELKAHSGEDEPWFVINGQVYDGTPYLESHPGGATSIINAAGQDATEEFVTIHSENAKGMMPSYHIGALSPSHLKALTSEGTESENDLTRPIFLQPKAWSKAILETKTDISHDSKIFSFRLDHAEQTIGLPIGQHLLMRLRDPATRDAIIRAYTPISNGKDKGILNILVKVYRDTPTQNGGKMTQALDSIPTGHWVDFKGPVGKFTYVGNGQCDISGKTRHVQRFIMICGGSGVTPIYQVLRAVTEDPDDKTECIVLYGNRLEEDILCRMELDHMVNLAKARARLVHSLSQPTESWTGRRGRMDDGLFQEEAGRKVDCQKETMILVCGPEALETSVKKCFLRMGWNEDDLLFF